MNENFHVENLISKASKLIESSRKLGANASDVAIFLKKFLTVKVRMGKVEEIESFEKSSFSLRVFIDGRTSIVSSNFSNSINDLSCRAIEMAKNAFKSPFEGLADELYLVKSPKNLDLFDPFQPTIDHLTQNALEIEESALSFPKIQNSGGAEASYQNNSFILLTSKGFCHKYHMSNFFRGCSVIAGEKSNMERDYDYSSSLHFSDMKSCSTIGINAAKKAIRRLGSRQVATGITNIVFDRRSSRNILQNIASMVNGEGIVRKTSFLRNYLGKKIFKEGINIVDNPILERGLGSRPFDGEGVENFPIKVVKDGVLKEWLLSSSIARELGRITNGRAIRCSGIIFPSYTNFSIEPGVVSPSDIIESLSKGFYVTEIFGHGVDLITGQYSQGVSGFWIQNGVLTYPVSRVTIASNFLDMLLNITAANDIDRNYQISSPTLLIEGMVLSGK